MTTSRQFMPCAYVNVHGALEVLIVVPLPLSNMLAALPSSLITCSVEFSVGIVKLAFAGHDMMAIVLKY